MSKLKAIAFGVIFAVLAVFSLAYLTADVGKAGDGDRCPATSKAKCDGLVFKKLGV
ncbi:hypothetical protein [Bradyrhizobium elkanii]|uniref:hypothetical protein n=1 Tax=Bradyrhizobium elkanii TaxID=29448 RepID=UPI0035177F8D